MREITNICICGGGALGHVCAAVLSNQDGIVVNLLTNHPEKWQHQFHVHTPHEKILTGNLFCISHSAEELIPCADIILLCLPAFLVEATLLEIRPHLTPGAIVGTVVGNSGFFLFAHQIFPSSTPLFAFQRVPYISRVIDYGKEGHYLQFVVEFVLKKHNVKENVQEELVLIQKQNNQKNQLQLVD